MSSKSSMLSNAIERLVIEQFRVDQPHLTTPNTKELAKELQKLEAEIREFKRVMRGREKLVR